MNEEAILLDYDCFDIDKKKYIGIVMYHKKSKSLLKCFVEYNKDIEDYLCDSLLEDVHEHLVLKIAKDGKLKLDFRL